jgi:hypothetical protein
MSRESHSGLTFSPEILRGGKSVYADTRLLQPSGDYSRGLVNCEISGYRHAQSMSMRLCSAPQLGE